jgi:hypothetical protein
MPNSSHHCRINRGLAASTGIGVEQR